jgi:acetyl/propionyl-CoA carboxylase alpha subunit
VALFERVLIANRGEISIRIAKSASSLGVESLAVFAPIDSLSLHTRISDHACELTGPKTPSSPNSAAQRD